MTQEHPAFQTLFLETDGAIATVTLNRPDALNAIDVAMAQDLQRAAQWLEARDEIRAAPAERAGDAPKCGVHVNESDGASAR